MQLHQEAWTPRNADAWTAILDVLFTSYVLADFLLPTPLQSLPSSNSDNKQRLRSISIVHRDREQPKRPSTSRTGATARLATMSKYDPPQGPPPGYPQQPPQAHYDAGPVGDARGANEGYYGGAPPQQYGQPGQYQQGPYGPPQGGPYQQQPMMYQQGPYPPQQGYYPPDQGRGSSGAGGCCAGIMAALACCCCLDVLF